MSRSLQDILRRRARLQAQSAALRGRVAEQAAVWRRPLSWLARAQAGARQLMARPAVTATALATGLGLLVALGPRRALAWGAKGWAAWRLWRSLGGRS